MKKTRYYCDLCGHEVELPQRDLVGFEYSTTYVDKKPVEKLIVRCFTHTERHFCKDCCELLYQFLSGLRKNT
jgi:hypothetical protein